MVDYKISFIHRYPRGTEVGVRVYTGQVKTVTEIEGSSKKVKRGRYVREGILKSKVLIFSGKPHLYEIEDYIRAVFLKDNRNDMIKEQKGLKRDYVIKAYDIPNKKSYPHFM